MKVLTQGVEAFYKCRQGQWKHLGTRRRMKHYPQIRRKLLSFNDTGNEHHICNESASGNSSAIQNMSRDGLCCSPETNQLLASRKENQTSMENCGSLCGSVQCHQEFSPLASCCIITSEVIQQLLLNCTCNSANGISKYAVYCIAAGICGLVVTLTLIIAACIKKFKRTKIEPPLDDAGVQEAPPEPLYGTPMSLYTVRPHLIHVTSVENDGDRSSRSSHYEYDNNFDNRIEYTSSSGSQESINNTFDTQGAAHVDHQSHSHSDSAVHLNESSASSLQVTPVKDLSEHEYDVSDFDDSLFNGYSNVFVTTADVHHADDAIRLPGMASRDRSSVDGKTSGVEDPVYDSVSNGSLESAEMPAVDDGIDDYSVYQNTCLEGRGPPGNLQRLHENDPTFDEAPSEVRVERHPVHEVPPRRHGGHAREITQIQLGTVFASGLSRLIETLTLPRAGRREGDGGAVPLAAGALEVSNTLPRSHRVQISNDYLVPVMPDYKGI
ncbi:unnamed protein product [Lymnaea stagnalis]|uniref:Uncharacterized protein n=1 Tax=Lymnaea stagnalis TaxID=6523 RepID=A0AAV2HBP0_LYMST